ncbi:MAG: hypothetical protein WBB37_01675 [bacterium]
MINKVITKERLALTLIFFFMIGFKVFSVYKIPYFNLKDDTGFFWTESALQQRSARMVAINGRLPILDEDAQYPEGLEYKDRLTALMEIVSGYIYRLFVPRQLPFHFFLIIFISIWSSLSIIPLYLSIRLVIENKISGLLACLFYAFTPAIYITVTAPAFELQDFALPLIFTHLYFFIRAMKSSDALKYSYAMISGAFLLTALSSWHLTQFYYAIFVLFIGIVAFFEPKTDTKPFYIITAISFLGGFLIPVLRTAGFLFSFSMLMSYGIVISTLMPVKKYSIKRASLLFLICIAIILTILVATARIPEYRFVYGLMLEKIKHLGMRPTDPSKLSWETLVMWVSPFTSPSVREIALFIGTLIIIGISGIVVNTKKLFKKAINFCDAFFLLFTVAFFPLYFLLIRLDVFLVWFLSLQTAYVFSTVKKSIRFLLVLCMLVNAYLLFNQPTKVLGPRHNYLLGLIKYMRHLTPQDAVVLTSFPYGPSIITYANRTILLHPKFEAKNMINKVKLFEHKLFEPENDFYDYCISYGADYFVYQADMLMARGPESIRYRTHNLTISKECVAYKFHFQPKDLNYFRLLYSNPHYRVYQVTKKDSLATDIPAEYFRIYDERIINLKNLGVL